MDNTNDIEIKYDGDLIKAYASNVCLWDDIDTEQPVCYNQEPGPIDLSYRPIQYMDFNTLELYKSYFKISEMIDRLNAQKNQSRRTSNYHDKWNIIDLRNYCQDWLDDVRFRQDGQNRWWVWDKLKYIFRRQLKQRMQWLQTLGIICYDMCQRLDEIDGGNDEQNPDRMVVPQHRIGFNA